MHRETIQPLIQIIDYGAGPGNITCIDANQTEPLIMTGDTRGCVKIWNYDTQSQKVVASIMVSESGVSAVKFIARKRWLVAVSRDCFIHVYKYEKELEKVTSLRAHDYQNRVCCSLDVHPTYPYVLSGCGRQIKFGTGTSCSSATAVAARWPSSRAGAPQKASGGIRRARKVLHWTEGCDKQKSVKQCCLGCHGIFVE